MSVISELPRPRPSASSEGLGQSEVDAIPTSSGPYVDAHEVDLEVASLPDSGVGEDA